MTVPRAEKDVDKSTLRALSPPLLISFCIFMAVSFFSGWGGRNLCRTYGVDACLIVCSRIGGCRGPQSVDKNMSINLILPTRITVRLNLQYALKSSTVLVRLPSPGYTSTSRRIYLDILPMFFLIFQIGELFSLYLEVSRQNMVCAYPKWSLDRIFAFLWCAAAVADGVRGRGAAGGVRTPLPPPPPPRAPPW